MVDNINLNKISPLLSSTERVRRVDRRQRDEQQPPFKSALKDKEKKKKKKKKKGENETHLDTRYAGDDPRRHVSAVDEDKKKEKKSESGQNKKIIDIRI